MTLEQMYKPEAYPKDLALKVEVMGAIAVSVANRWMLGWPERVQALLMAGTYLNCLQVQVELEKDVLAEAGGLNHLSRREILQMHEINEAPPMVEVSTA